VAARKMGNHHAPRVIAPTICHYFARQDAERIGRQARYACRGTMHRAPTAPMKGITSTPTSQKAGMGKANMAIDTIGNAIVVIFFIIVFARRKSILE